MKTTIELRRRSKEATTTQSRRTILVAVEAVVANVKTTGKTMIITRIESTMVKIASILRVIVISSKIITTEEEPRGKEGVVANVAIKTKMMIVSNSQTYSAEFAVGVKVDSSAEVAAIITTEMMALMATDNSRAITGVVVEVLNGIINKTARQAKVLRLTQAVAT